MRIGLSAVVTANFMRPPMRSYGLRRKPKLWDASAAVVVLGVAHQERK
jgi:hypothetical protein